MALKDYMVPIGQNTNICFDCKNACGKCSWTAVDPKTKKIKYEPVPGWTAEEVMLNLGNYGKLKRHYVKTYHITACPLFTRDSERPVKKGVEFDD